MKYKGKKSIMREILFLFVSFIFTVNGWGRSALEKSEKPDMEIDLRFFAEIRAFHIHHYQDRATKIIYIRQKDIKDKLRYIQKKVPSKGNRWKKIQNELNQKSLRVSHLGGYPDVKKFDGEIYFRLGEIETSGGNTIYLFPTKTGLKTRRPRRVDADR